MRQKKHNVYPIQGGYSLGSRQVSAFGKGNEFTLYPEIDQILNFAGPQFYQQSFSITANVTLTGKEEGVLFSTGGAFDGLSLFIKDGRFQVAHNTGGQLEHLESEALVAGRHQLTFDLNFIPPPGENLIPTAPAGTSSILINGTKVNERPITAAEIQYIAKYKDGVDVGRDLNSPVSDRYRVPFAFTGKLHNIKIHYR